MTQAQTSPASSGTASAKVIALADTKSDPLLKLVLEQLDDDWKGRGEGRNVVLPGATTI